MLRAYKYRLYPTSEQKSLLEQHFGSVRLVYNLALEARQRAYREHGVSLWYNDTAAQLKDMKDEFSWLKDINSQSLQSSLRNADTAYKNFFNGAGYPQNKSRNKKQSFCCPQNVSVDFGKKLISLPKFREGIAIVLHRPFTGTVKSVTISRTTTNKYFASVLVDTSREKREKPEPSIERAIGIDVGIKSFAAIGNHDLSRSEKIDNPKWLKDSLELLKRRQRQFDRKKRRAKKGSKNRRKARLRLSRLHERITNRRNDFLHKLTYRLTHDSQVDTICIEDLNIRGMKRNHNLAQSISDAAWGEFFRQLEYKADWNRKTILKAPRFAPTSKKCRCCHAINHKLTLSDREWLCTGCGTLHDRDESSTVNIVHSAFDEYNKNRDGLPESTLGELQPLSSPKGKRKAATVNQEKFRKDMLALPS